jgi:phage gpG-like protein
MATWSRGGHVRFDWTPEPNTIADALVEAAAHIAKPHLILAAARQQIIEDVKRRFRSESSPQGVEWAAWSKKYTRNREGKKLQLSGALYGAVTAPESYPIDGTSLFIETSAMETSYGAIHQTGMTGRPRSGDLPARPFMGYSAKAQERIYILFLGWVNQAVAIFERGGRTYMQARGPGVLFGRKIMGMETTRIL